MAGDEPEKPPVAGDLTVCRVQELQRVAESFSEIEEILLVELNSEPDKPRNGMIVLADGTNWNPGAGAGFYGRRAGSWFKLG